MAAKPQAPIKLDEVEPSPPAELQPDPTLKVPVPATPEMPGKPGAKPEIAANPPRIPDFKPDTSPVIGPEPKPDVQPTVKPATSVVPLQAPTFSVNELDASLKAVSGVTTVDAKSYADWCKLAEVVTYVDDGAGLETQKQALQILAKRAVSGPTAVPAIARISEEAVRGPGERGRRRSGRHGHGCGHEERPQWYSHPH